MRKGYNLVVPICLILFICSLSYADVPATLNFQGKLTNIAGAPSNGTYSVLFSIWDAPTGGSQLWSETQSVSIASGIYNVALGTSTSLSAEIFASSSTWLQIKVGADSPMTPRIRFNSVPFSFTSAVAKSLISGLPINDLFAALNQVRVNVGVSGYAVPANKNLVIVSARGGGCPIDCHTYYNGESSTTYCSNGNCRLSVSGSHTATTVTGLRAKVPSILGAGDVISSTGSAITVRVKGFLIPENVVVVLQDLGVGASYVVPAGKTFYFQLLPGAESCTGSTSVDGFVDPFYHKEAGIMNSGQTVTNNTSCTLTLNGYLR